MVENITNSGTNVSEYVWTNILHSEFDPPNIWNIHANFLVLISKESRDITHVPQLRHNVSDKVLTCKYVYIMNKIVHAKFRALNRKCEMVIMS